jgi:hypothetical protein
MGKVQFQLCMLPVSMTLLPLYGFSVNMYSADTISLVRFCYPESTA